MEKVLITYLDVEYMETHTSQSTLLHIQVFFLKIFSIKIATYQILKRLQNLSTKFWKHLWNNKWSGCICTLIQIRGCSPKVHILKEQKKQKTFELYILMYFL